MNQEGSYADSEGKYNVFLSFRGADTRLGFTDHLYNGLVDAGIYTFRDSENLHISGEIGPELLNAIENSKIWIPIFSKNYADSKWCLREFAHILKCQLINDSRKIYPVFYDVNVDDVKNQQESYKKAFEEHEKNMDEETILVWRKALSTVGQFKGYELKTETNGHEAKLVKKLVKDVLLVLKKNYVDVRDDELVGMDHHVRKMTGLLHADFNDVRIIGIHGMGGIGKTTIAKAMFNRLCDSFDGSCFLENVREKAKHHPGGLFDLQKELLFGILKIDFPDIINISDGIKKIKNIVHKKKVIIVLDDVDQKFQFEKLVGECDWLHKASRIMVTTRNKEVLNALEVTCNRKGLHQAYESYEPELMTFGDSLKLFSNHAFMTEFPPRDYASISEKITSIADGLPLVLVTLGSLFSGITQKTLWMSKLKKLESIMPADVMGKLRISFDDLDTCNKNIFLDIACFFTGKDKGNPCYMWEDCEFVPDDGINTLVLRSLVKIGEDNVFRMHDHLRDLGRHIVREEPIYKLSRVWHSKESFNTLNVGLDVEKIEALELDDQEPLQDRSDDEVRIGEGKIDVRHLTGQSFNRLQNLRFLQLGSAALDGDFNYIFSKLRWLQWRSCGKVTPVNLNLKNLVILELSLLEEWEGWSIFKEARKLKVLKLLESNHITEYSCSTFKGLEDLSIHSCKSLLEVTDLSVLVMLKKISLKDLSSLREIAGLGLLKLRMLKELFLEGCNNLCEVGDIGGLVSLEVFSVKYCHSIVKLSGLSNLGRLNKLHLYECQKLTEIEGLRGLVTLEILELSCCSSLGKLLDFSDLKNMKRVKLNWLEYLVEIRGLKELKLLEYFCIQGCNSVETLPDVSELKCLKELVVRNCDELCEIVGLTGLVSLESLDVYGCRSLGGTFDLSSSRNLRSLGASNLYELREIKGLEESRFLEMLWLLNCRSLEKVSNLSNLTRLKTLNSRWCDSAQGIEGFHSLLLLEYLDFSYSKLLPKSLDISSLKYLKVLRVYYSNHLTEIRGLEELKLLEELRVHRCSFLEKLTDLSNLKRLERLDIEGCSKLYEIKGLSSLISLVELNLYGCSLIGKTLHFSCSNNLKEVSLLELKQLTKITGIEHSKSLELLNVRGCCLLEELPDLSTLANLKKLDVEGCKKLPKIKSLE